MFSPRYLHTYLGLIAALQGLNSNDGIIRIVHSRCPSADVRAISVKSGLFLPGLLMLGVFSEWLNISNIPDCIKIIWIVRSPTHYIGG